MQEVKFVIMKLFIGLATLTLSYLCIYGIYEHSHQISNWFLNKDNFFFVMLVKYAGIIWSAAFLRVGGDWIMKDINPFKKQKYET